jgi:aquaporin Z
LIEGGIALQQLWFFWVMPIIGAILAGLVYKWFETKPKETE